MSRLLIPVLLCGVCACACADYGVKLCGREFIRAVIFTCGGSRWKRSTDLESPGPDPKLLHSYRGSSKGEQKFSWIKNSDAAPDNLSSIRSSSSFSSSLSDLVRAVGAQRKRRDESGVSEEVKRSRLNSLSSSGSLGHERRFREDRRRRNYSLGLAGLCCSQGCTKNDIGRLC